MSPDRFVSAAAILRRSPRHLVASAILTFLAVAAVTTDGGLSLGARAVAAECEQGWTLLQTAESSGGEFYGVSASSPSNGWAVGAAQSVPMVQRWDGQSWSLVPIDGLPAGSVLNDIEAIAPDDLWAVGLTGGYSQESQPLILHYDGGAWSVVPGPAGLGGVLNGLTAVSPDDIWAVGGSVGGTSVEDPITLHWNGSTWTDAPSMAGFGAELFDVSHVSASDVWAVGDRMTMHWDGADWNLVPMPSHPATGLQRWTSVSAIAASDVWAVGSQAMYHWDGSSWTLVHDLYQGSPDPWVGDVDAFATDDVWAVGDAVWHWDGSAWSEVVDAAPTYSEHTGVATVADGTDRAAWVVGRTTSDPPDPLVERFCGPVVAGAGTESLPGGGGPPGDHGDSQRAIIWMVGGALLALGGLVVLRRLVWREPKEA